MLPARAAVAAALPVAALLAVPGAAAAATMTSPSRAHVGSLVRATATGVKPGRYALTIVADDTPVRTACVARLGKRHRAVNGVVHFRGHVPHKLTCYENDNVRLGTVPLSPGRYHLVAGVPDGPAGFNVKNSFVRRRIRITR